MTGLSPLELIMAIACISLSTFATRAGVLLLGERVALSRRVETALRFAPACALTALILPEVVFAAGALDLSMGNPRLPAAIAAAAFMLWRQNILGCIATGMTVYAIVRFL